MTAPASRSPSHEPGPGATHSRPVPPDADDTREGDRPSDPDDDRPIDVAPRTGPFEMGPAEAGMPADDVGHG